jgi:hypothetical protein
MPASSSFSREIGEPKFLNLHLAHMKFKVPDANKAESCPVFKMPDFHSKKKKYAYNVLRDAIVQSPGIPSLNSESKIKMLQMKYVTVQQYKCLNETRNYFHIPFLTI